MGASMCEDETTISVYDTKASDYAKAFPAAGDEPGLQRFMSMLPKGAVVLDLGCGPGAHAAALYAQGFKVTATDASIAMVEMARRHKGLIVRQARFSDLREQDVYDGVWANFSLLHAPRADLPDHLLRIATALRQGGIFHIGMKTGEGERRDALGRFYAFYTVDQLCELLKVAGFDVIEVVLGESAGLAGTVDPWVEMLAILRA